MPRDDREQNFDKALASHLGSSSAAHASDGNDCLDAETLAAYHERLLDPEEMAQRKAHIASCERCQEVLAQLEATDAIPVEADRDLMLDQIVLEQPDSEATPAGTPVAATEPQLETHPGPESEDVAPPMAAAPQAESPAAPEPEIESELEIEHEPDLVAASAAIPTFNRVEAKTPAVAAPASPTLAVPVFAAAAKSAPPTSSTITFRSPREDRPKIVRFVAIFGAIAAAVIFWLVFRDQNKSFDLAQNHQQKLEMPPQSPAQAPAPPADEKSKASPPGTSESNAAASQSAAAAPTAQPQQALSKTPTDSATNALDEGKTALDAAKALELKTKKDAAAQAPTFIPRDDSATLSAGAGRSGRPAPTASPRKSTPASPVEKALADANAVLHPASNSPSSIPATPPPARTKMNPGVVNEAAPAGSSVSGLAQVSASADALSKPINGRMVTTLTPLSVPAPSGKTIWRIGQAGQIQRSTDSGTTWSIQPSGVVTDLIAGSAYSDQVCWLVGRNGTILRTINGGATWQKLASPSNVDLLGVFSINADSATITDAAGRAFETTTGGSHWTRTRLQE